MPKIHVASSDSRTYYFPVKKYKDNIGLDTTEAKYNIIL